MSHRHDPTPDAGQLQDAFDGLLRVFDRAVRELGDRGESDLACRLAAQAWSIVRRPVPRAGRRLNATLHYLVLPMNAAAASVEPVSVEGSIPKPDHER